MIFKQKWIMVAVVWLLALSVWDSGSARAATEKTSLAVLDLRPGSGIETGEADSLSETLRVELFKTGRFQIVEREEMRRILTEKKARLSGLTGTGFVSEAGRLVSARHMVAGSATKLGRRYYLTLRLIHTGSGKIEWADSYRAGEPEELADGAGVLAGRLAAHLSGETVKGVVAGAEPGEKNQEAKPAVGTPGTGPGFTPGGFDPDKFNRDMEAHAEKFAADVERSVDYFLSRLEENGGHDYFRGSPGYRDMYDTLSRFGLLFGTHVAASPLSTIVPEENLSGNYIHFGGRFLFTIDNTHGFGVEFNVSAMANPDSATRNSLHAWTGLLWQYFLPLPVESFRLGPGLGVGVGTWNSFPTVSGATWDKNTEQALTDNLGMYLRPRLDLGYRTSSFFEVGLSLAHTAYVFSAEQIRAPTGDMNQLSLGIQFNFIVDFRNFIPPPLAAPTEGVSPTTTGEPAATTR